MKTDVTSLHLQCPDCGVPVETMESQYREGDFFNPIDFLGVGRTVIVLEPCAHEVDSSALEEAFG